MCYMVSSNCNLKKRLIMIAKKLSIASTTNCAPQVLSGQYIDELKNIATANSINIGASYKQMFFKKKHLGEALTQELSFIDVKQDISLSDTTNFFNAKKNPCLYQDVLGRSFHFAKLLGFGSVEGFTTKAVNVIGYVRCESGGVKPVAFFFLKEAWNLDILEAAKFTANTIIVRPTNDPVLKQLSN